MASEKSIEEVKKRIFESLGLRYFKRIKAKKYFIGMKDDKKKIK